MSDDLTPAEQARAARWAADWVTKEWGGQQTTTALALREYAKSIDLPETVESLRAERDNAQANEAHWREQFRLVCDESACRLGDRNVARDKLERAECVIRSHSDALNAMRTERDEALRANERFEGEQEELVQALNKLSAANYTIARLRATHVEAEAAWERSKRQPRVWKAGDPEPDDVQQVRDCYQFVWQRNCDNETWQCRGRYLVWTPWRQVLAIYGPLTEVLPGGAV